MNRLLQILFANPNKVMGFGVFRDQQPSLSANIVDGLTTDTK